MTGEGEGTNGLVIIDNTPKETKVSVSKEWQDESDADRPEEIAYKLSAKAGETDLTYADLGLANEEAMTVKGLKTATPAYSAAWEKLPKYTLNGTEIEYTVAEEPVAHYELVETENNKGESEWTWTFTNRKSDTDFTFTKQWLNASQNEDTTWPTDSSGKQIPITVTLKRRLKYDGQESRDYDTTFELTYTLSSGSVTVNNIDYPISQPDPNAFSFKISNLEKYGQMKIDDADKSGEWVYTLTEAQVSGYNLPVYKPSDSNAHVEFARDGYIIQNAVMTISLPATGGLGTTALYVLGSILTLLAAALLIAKHRKEYLEQDWHC